MGLTKNIKGLCTLDRSVSLCRESIEVTRVTGKIIYASWEMYDQNDIKLAGVSRNYFVDKDELEESDVFPVIFENIANYKVNRRKVFSEIEIVVD